MKIRATLFTLKKLKDNPYGLKRRTLRQAVRRQVKTLVHVHCQCFILKDILRYELGLVECRDGLWRPPRPGAKPLLDPPPRHRFSRILADFQAHRNHPLAANFVLPAYLAER